MKLRVLLLTLVSTVLAQTGNLQRDARAPQGQIQYNDASGLKVNWKYFSPQNQQNQWRSHVEAPQRTQRAESGTTQIDYARFSQPHQQQTRYVQPQQQHNTQTRAIQQQRDVGRFSQQSQLVQAPVKQYQENQFSYKPYSAVPSHIKQLLLRAYEPQRPYVDPSAFLYTAHFGQERQQPQIPQYEAPASRYQGIDEIGSKGPKQQGRIVYRTEYENQQPEEQRQIHRIASPIERPVQSYYPTPKLVFDKNMPSELQQILTYQAQLPYDVIANHILYKPKSPFIPKPIPEESKGPYSYRSKVYYLKNGDFESDYPSSTYKPVDEDQRH